MTSIAPTEIRIPDIGDFKNVPVIEVLVKPGDAVAADQTIIVLESDKATLDVPAPEAGTVAEIMVKPGDQVSQGTVVLTFAAPAQGPPLGGCGRSRRRRGSISRHRCDRRGPRRLYCRLSCRRPG